MSRDSAEWFAFASLFALLAYREWRTVQNNRMVAKISVDLAPTKNMRMLGWLSFVLSILLSVSSLWRGAVALLK